MRQRIDIDESDSFAADVKKRIAEFNAMHWDASLRRPLGLKIVDDEGQLQAAVTGRTFGHWLLLDYLWVDSKYRGEGLGTQLLIAAEQQAQARGCRYVLLDTLDFQARPFYQRHGYQLVWTQPDYPLTGCKYFLRKDFG